MNFGQIRDRMVERMAEYQAGAAEVGVNASIAPDTIYARLTTAYRRMLRTVASRKPDKVIALSTFTYAANTEHVGLSAALKYRDIFSLERQVSTNVWEPIEPLTSWQDQQARIDDYFTTNPSMVPGEPVDSTYGYMIELDQLYIKPLPVEDLTIRARYFQAVTLLTAADAANVPVVIQEEHHDLMALVAARSFYGETRSNTQLESEYQELWAEFVRWITETPKKGPRFVIERD